MATYSLSTAAGSRATTASSNARPARRLLRGTPSLTHRSAFILHPSQKCPRQESNLVFDLRRVACDPAHSEDFLFFEYLAEESNLIRQLRTLPCFRHTREASLSKNQTAISRPGVEPGPGASETPMRSFTPSGQLPSTLTPGCPLTLDQRVRGTVSSGVVKNRHEREESNPVGRFWRPLALPGAHS
jgi:hypothetical protein